VLEYTRSHLIQDRSLMETGRNIYDPLESDADRGARTVTGDK